MILDRMLRYYVYFKETLSNPTSGFKKQDLGRSWTNISIYNLFFLYWMGNVFFLDIFYPLIGPVLTVVALVTLFGVNHFILGRRDSFRQIISSFGDMQSLQIILLLLIFLLGEGNTIGTVVRTVFIINTLTIFSLHVFKSFKSSKLDEYHQIVLAYTVILSSIVIALVVLY